MATLCRQCAAEVENGAGVCSRCGVSVENNVQPHAGLPEPAAPDFQSAALGGPRDLNGIGGWLILVAFGLAVSPFISLHGIYTDLRLLHGVRYQALLAVRPGLGGLLLFEAATNTIVLTALIALNFLFYLKKKAFPVWIIAFLAFQLVVILIDHSLTLRFNPSAGPAGVVRALIAALIWIPYYLRSKRVKQTFVR